MRPGPIGGLTLDGGSRAGGAGLGSAGAAVQAARGEGSSARPVRMLHAGGGVKGLVPGNFAPPPPAPWLCSNARRRTAGSTWRGLRREGGIPADAGEGRRGLVVWVCAFPGGQGAWTGLPGACMGWAGLWGWMDGGALWQVRVTSRCLPERQEGRVFSRGDGAF